MKVRLCELCKEAAAVFCPADAAFLCRVCDARVHGANFLVARHVRQSLHATCHDPVASLEDEEDSVVDTLSSSSSACNSTTTKKGTTTTTSSCNYSNDRERKSQRPLVNSSNVKGVFIDWCGRLGLGGGQDSSEVVRTACAALKVCTEHLPLRVGLAAALWLGLRLGVRRRSSSLLQTWKVAKRLEEVSGVPARVILAVGSKLARINGRQKQRRDLEEGWAESS